LILILIANHYFMDFVVGFFVHKSKIISSRKHFQIRTLLTDLTN